MNVRLLESKMKLYGDTNITLAKYLDRTPQALSAKKKGKNGDFTRKEIDMIKDRYSLTPEEIDAIFFAKQVS